MPNTSEFFVNNPRKLFLLDSLGAILTASMLFFVLRKLNNFFGMPIIVLENLALLALCFAFYSIICFLFLKKNWSFYLHIIAFANLSYGLLTMFLLIAFYTQITWLDWFYFLTEIVVIFVLVYLELKVARALNLKSS